MSEYPEYITIRVYRLKGYEDVFRVPGSATAVAYKAAANTPSISLEYGA